MATPQDRLEQMFNDADGQVEDLENQIAQVEALRDDFVERKVAIRDALMTPAADDLTSYLDGTKVPEIAQLTGQDVEVVFGSTYNNTTPDANIYTATITDWAIIDTTTAATVYAYLGTGWDGDAFITKLVADWNFGWDYLTKPLTDLEGNYGILPNIAALNVAIDQLEASKQKIGDSKDTFGDYI